jgi:hypothetical protein
MMGTIRNDYDQKFEEVSARTKLGGGLNIHGILSTYHSHEALCSGYADFCAPKFFHQCMVAIIGLVNGCCILAHVGRQLFFCSCVSVMSTKSVGLKVMVWLPGTLQRNKDRMAWWRASMFGW